MATKQQQHHGKSLNQPTVASSHSSPSPAHSSASSRPPTTIAPKQSVPLMSPTSPLSTLLIYPGVGLGPFRLGSSIGCVLSYVQQHAMSLRSNELICSPQQPTSGDITLELKDLGVRLRFDPHQQRLTLIDIYDHKRIQLMYMRSPITPRQNQSPTFNHLAHLFGPTFPGTYDSESQMYLLQYPGVCMTFHLPNMPESPGEHGHQVITLPDGSSPKLERFFIHFGDTVQAHATALPPLLPNDTYFEPIIVQISKGLYFERRGVFIGFDSFAQDLLTDIGAPQNIYIKSSDSDKMNIHKQMNQVTQQQQQQQHHSPNVQSRHLSTPLVTTRPSTSDYFYNYNLLGFDVLLDGITHRVKKFILHTNFIDRPDFNQYAKCNFLIARDETAPNPNSATNKGGMSSLELPPTAVASGQSSRSMLQPSSTGSSNSPASTSPPQSISINTGVEDVSSGKKKKKKAAAAAALAATTNDTKDDPPVRSPVPRSSFANLPPTGSPSHQPQQTPNVSFSPSLSPSILPQSQATVITPDSKWIDVLAVLGPCSSRPMVSSSHGPSSSSSSPSLDNPFGSTYFYAYPGAVFEVCKNYHLASVTLFKEE